MALSLLMLLGTRSAAGQVQQREAALRYSASQLDCARFRETSESAIQTATGGRVQDQSSGRTAVWRFRANPAVNGLVLEGWLDSLSLWRKSREGTIRPDTDGLLGGRYRGMLSETGAYAGRVRPFIPDEVAEVAGMAAALDDFFPPLPPGPLQPGKSWSGSAGVVLRRLADSALSGVPLYRFELELRRESNSARLPADTALLRFQQVSRERGSFVWHPVLGLLRRDRRIVVETSVPASRSIRQPVRSRIEQRITVLRDLAVPPAPAGC